MLLLGTNSVSHRQQLPTTFDGSNQQSSREPTKSRRSSAQQEQSAIPEVRIEIDRTPSNAADA